MSEYLPAKARQKLAKLAAGSAPILKQQEIIRKRLQSCSNENLLEIKQEAITGGWLFKKKVTVKTTFRRY